MDLYQALHTINSRVHLRGRSDHDLVKRVSQEPNCATSTKMLSTAAGLERGISMRPLEALHALSYVTRPRYRDDLLDRYAQWGLMRYLGFFELAHTSGRLPELKVSDAGRRITGNQRRVVSEEMGIGFGALLARRWFGRTGRAGAPTRIIDIDAALDDRYIYAGGLRQSVGTTGTRRPDYVIIGDDLSTPGRYRVRVLECKGTRWPAHAPRQLASAVGQLGGLSVDGRVPTGLAVSMITGSTVSYLAIDPDDDEEPSYAVNSDTIERVEDFRFRDDGMADVSATDLVNASVRASWAILADFGGNLEGLYRWAPGIMRRRLDDRRQDRRVTFDTPFGVARGTSITFEFDQIRLNVGYAIDAAVDDAISGDDAEPVLAAQAAFAHRLRQSPNFYLDTGPNQAYSATADGSIFSIVLSSAAIGAPAR